MASSPPADDRSSRPWWRSGEVFWIVLVAALVIAGRLTPFKPLRSFLDRFSWLTEQALKITKELFESYGYLTVFLAPLLENTIFLGVLIPGTIVMLLAGLAAHDGLISFGPALPLGILGAWIGDTISYGIGRFWWHRLGEHSRFARWSERMREPLLNQSRWIVVFYHFAGYSRLVGPAAAGFMRMPFRRWLPLDFAGAALWVSVYMTVGYLLGVFSLSLDATDENVRAVEIVLFIFAVAAVIFAVSRGRRRTGDGDAKDAPAPEDERERVG